MNNQEIAAVLDNILELMEAGLDDNAFDEITRLKSTLEGDL